jgi:hypothetical protein
MKYYKLFYNLKISPRFTCGIDVHKKGGSKILNAFEEKILIPHYNG